MKILNWILVVFTVFTGSQVLAADNQEQNTSAQAQVVIDSHDKNEINSGRWTYVPQSKLDPAIIAALQPVMVIGADYNLPEHLKKEGWDKVIIRPELMKPVPEDPKDPKDPKEKDLDSGISRFEAQLMVRYGVTLWDRFWGKKNITIESSPKSIYPEIGLHERLAVISIYPDPELFDFEVVDWPKAVGYGECNLERVLGASVEAGARIGARIFLFTTSTKYLTKAGVMALGSVAVGAAQVGPVKLEDQKIAAAAGGGGIGSSESWIDGAPRVKAVAFRSITKKANYDEIMAKRRAQAEEAMKRPKAQQELEDLEREVKKREAEEKLKKLNKPEVAGPTKEQQEAQNKADELQKAHDEIYAALQKCLEELGKTKTQLAEEMKKPKYSVSPASMAVLFDFEKTNIKKSEEKKMAALAEFVKRNPARKKLILAHTDIRELVKDMANPRYSVQRANEIKKELVRLGAAREEDLLTYGGACYNPVIKKATTEAQHALNRYALVIELSEGQSLENNDLVEVLKQLAILK